MIWIPLKWIPWIFLIAGVLLLVSGEANMTSIIVMAVGGVWLYLQHQNKQ